MKSNNRLPASLVPGLGLGLAALALTACSYIPGVNRLTGEDGPFRDRQGEYLKAETIPRTQIPAELDSYVIDDLYVIPETADTETTAFLNAPRPRPLEGRSDREVVIQRMGERSWVVVDASPSQVWPRLRDYWNSKGIPLAGENPSAGVMETGWVTLQGNVVTKEKFRVLVEPGFQDNSTEVRLLHKAAPQSVPSVEVGEWPDQSDDQELAFDMLSDLSGYLADVADLYQASSVSFLAGSISNEGKADLVTDDGRNLLRLRADYDRSWGAIGRALERAGVEVVSRDQSQGIYHVQYVIPRDDDKKGFFRRLVSFGDGGAELEPHAIRLRLEENGSAVEVAAEPLESAQDDERQEDEASEPGASLLRTLMNNLA